MNAGGCRVLGNATGGVKSDSRAVGDGSEGLRRDKVSLGGSS